MASYLEMSLEDIIQRKKKGNPRKQPIPTNNPKAQIPLRNFPISDARNKIISRKRNQITDARDKLAELAKRKDARLKLEQLRLGRVKTQGVRKNIIQNRGKFMRNIPNKDRVFIDSSRQVVSQPLHSSTRLPARRSINTKRFLENRSIEAHALEKTIRPKPILRTVENDLDITDDPMGEEYESIKMNSLNRKASLQLKIITHNNDVRETRTATTVHRSAISEKEKSPPRPASILKKRPMAALRNDKLQKTEKSHLENRIIVSNLRSSVTGGDIEELFGDVGGMLESRLVRPGTAEVIYKSLENAQKAVDLYHNRQLDGQPMNCLLVTPRSTVATPRSSSKSGLYSTNSNVEPDISTFHKVLFSNL